LKKSRFLYLFLIIIFLLGCASGPRSEEITISGSGIIKNNYVYELTLYGTHKILFEIYLENIGYSDTTDALIKKLIYQGKNPGEYADYLEKQFIENYATGYFPPITDDDGTQYFYKSNFAVNYVIDFHNDDFIIIHYNDYVYSGGAHGNYQTFYYIIDIASERILNISDIIRPVPDAELNALIKKTYDFQNYLRDNIWPPDSINISNNGVFLLWNIYSITPYVAGLININLVNANPYLTEKGQAILEMMR